MSKPDLSRDLIFVLLETTEQFSVDFDDAWQWIGWKAKRDGREVLLNNFIEGVDFLRKGTKSPTGGRPSEWIVLTVECFKSLAMMAGTERGRQSRRYFLDCELELKRRIAEEGKRQLVGTYTRRVSLSFQMPEPEGHFTVFHKSSHLLIYVEVEMKMPINQFDLLDGSVGIRWAKYRKDQEWAGDRIPYNHVFPDHRHVQSAWAYPLAELPHFDAWLRNTYMPSHLPVYLRDKYGAIVTV